MPPRDDLRPPRRQRREALLEQERRRDPHHRRRPPRLDLGLPVGHQPGERRHHRRSGPPRAAAARPPPAGGPRAPRSPPPGRGSRRGRRHRLRRRRRYRVLLLGFGPGSGRGPPPAPLQAVQLVHQLQPLGLRRTISTSRSAARASSSSSWSCRRAISASSATRRLVGRGAVDDALRRPRRQRGPGGLELDLGDLVLRPSAHADRTDQDQHGPHRIAHDARSSTLCSNCSVSTTCGARSRFR